MNETVFSELRQYAESVFQCGPDSVHGPGHWRNVEEMVIRIGPDTGADIVVGRLFAVFHDCCRVADDGDRLHGPRAAGLLRKIIGTRFFLDASRLQLLLYAVSGHTEGELSTDPTIGTCWDADRLDLGRVGIIPNAFYMSTDAGRKIAESGYGRGRLRHT